MTDAVTIGNALAHGAGLINKRDAKLFLSHLTGYSVDGVVLNERNEIPPEKYAMYLEYIKRRQTGEPLQYIIGKWEFMGLPFITDKRALIPRPETELLVEEAFAFIKKISAEEERPIRALDVCTGSGCIAIALACLLRENLEIVATDISPAALSLARENAEKNTPAPEKITFIETDLLEGVDGDFDIIISNPPYITSGEMATLSPTVRDHEPHLALDGGADGLDIYRRLIPQCKKALRTGGALFLEIGSPEVWDLMEKSGFENINLLHDYAEIERIVTGVKPNV
ncbi:MAG: peptide chain release factor N(5)-glutamine methyltransferase [Defluviitaleaceae bacterium]|nr:peptide chain release factor N(5)-glutamine methyltransferase [Defluviitaleaceae bacterium]MCL2263439.1 peptide chain release factor N(5)-glutamine methyltransferase [Defluviitaleaceae bacterium]